MLLALTLISCLSAIAGVLLPILPQPSRHLIPFSGGVLGGVTLFWLFPELSAGYGWVSTVGALLASLALLWLVDRKIYALCPSCSHTHHHDDCGTRLHGFAPPLLLAAGLHSFFDGWGVTLAGQGSGQHLAQALALAIVAHKLPEGLAFGAMLRHALRNRRRAMLLSVSAQAMVLVGGWTQYRLSPYLGRQWILLFLALAGGSFLYLSAHAIHGEWRRRANGAWPAALAGVILSAALAFVIRHA